MRFASFPSKDHARCEKWIRDIKDLGPTPGRVEFERDPVLLELSKLYSIEGGLEFLMRLETLASTGLGVYCFSRMPTLAQIQQAVEDAYGSSRLDDLRRILRAHVFFWGAQPGEPASNLNDLSRRIIGESAPVGVTRFCEGCGFEGGGTASCERCGSSILLIEEYHLSETVQKGLALHVPSELYLATSLEGGGYHLIRVEREEHGFGISLTFSAFGMKVDVDALGIGHPAAIVLALITTSKVDQTKAAKAKGSLDSLVKFVKERHTDMPPAQSVLVTTSTIEPSLDLLGLERSGMTILGGQDIRNLSAAFARIPGRLTGS